MIFKFIQNPGFSDYSTAYLEIVTDDDGTIRVLLHVDGDDYYDGELVGEDPEKLARAILRQDDNREW